MPLALVGVGDGNLYDRAHDRLPTVKGADSTFVYDYAQDHAARRHRVRQLTFMVRGVQPDAASTQDAVTQAARAVAQLPDVTRVSHALRRRCPVPPPPKPRQLGPTKPRRVTALGRTDGKSFLLMVSLCPVRRRRFAAHAMRTRGVLISGASATPAPRPTSCVYSDPLLYHDFTTQIETDLVTGEAVALPVALLVMVLVFGGFLAASAPLIGALASIAGGLAVLFGFSYPITLDQSAINVVTVLGIGLSIDYGLLIVSRYREEIATRGDDAAPRRA